MSGIARRAPGFYSVQIEYPWNAVCTYVLISNHGGLTVVQFKTKQIVDCFGQHVNSVLGT